MFLRAQRTISIATDFQSSVPKAMASQTPCQFSINASTAAGRPLCQATTPRPCVVIIHQASWASRTGLSCGRMVNISRLSQARRWRQMYSMA